MRFCEPMNATSPSTTRILRWLRRSGRWYLALQRHDRQHQVPLDRGACQPRRASACTSGCPATQMVEQQPHAYAALGGPDQGGEEGIGHVVPRRDVELDVHEPRRPLHAGGHGGDAPDVVGEQLGGVPGKGREGAERPVEGRHRRDVRQPGLPLGELGDLDGALVDGLVHLGLPRLPLPIDPGAAEEQEGEQPEQGDRDHQDQPRHPGGGLAVARDDAQGRHHHPDLEEHEGDPQQGRDSVHHLPPLGAAVLSRGSSPRRRS